MIEQIDDVITDWHGSVDAMQWRPDLIEEIDRKQREELAAVARLVAAHTNATFDEALDAVQDVNEYGPDSRGWALCFEAMRVALARYVDPILAAVPEESHGEALRQLTPSMVSAFKQLAAREAAA